jgi:hypothetical protein
VHPGRVDIGAAVRPDDQQQQREALEPSADLAAVGAELLDDAGVEARRQSIM